MTGDNNMSKLKYDVEFILKGEDLFDYDICNFIHCQNLLKG